MSFLGSFVSYLLLVVISAALMGAGVFLGITLRKRKDAKAETADAAAEPRENR